MKKLITFAALLMSYILNAQVLWQMNKDTVMTYYYQDGDEFSGETITKEKWGSWYGWARSISSNKEQQYYSEFENHQVKDGCLYLSTEKKNVEARLVDWMSDNDSIKSGKGKFEGMNKRTWKYKSGLIHSRNSFLKGYFEIKFKAPDDKGLWPAFWLYGGTPNEEIDIMELKGEREDQIHVDTHCQKCDLVRNPIGQKRSFGGWLKLNGKLNEGFNVVSGLWDDNEVRFYLNGKCIAVSKVKFNKPKALVANVAVADDKGPFHPGPKKEDESFAPFVIDYMRIWTKDETKASSMALKNESANVLPDNTTAKQQPKMLYGRKKDHANDGIFVSLISKEDGTLKLYCNGLGKKENYKVKVSTGDQIQYEKTSSERELNIPVAPSNGTKVEVWYGNKKAEKIFLLTR